MLRKRSLILFSIACFFLTYIVALIAMHMSLNATPISDPQQDKESSHKPVETLRASREEKTGRVSIQQLPNWMIKYFQWHKQIRSSLSLNNWNDHKYLILTCLDTSIKCGGTADRLSALPFLLRVASQSHRVLLIHWGRPAALEQFLLPPVGGMDWRVPVALREKLLVSSNPSFVTTQDKLLTFAALESKKVVTCRFQSSDHGAVYYDDNKNPEEPTFSSVTRTVWNVLFTPAPKVAQKIVDIMNASKLRPGEYVASHLRALYAVKDREPALVNYWAKNAINCSSQLLASLDSQLTAPIFFAADSLAASVLASRYGSKANVTVVTRRYKKEPLHLDKASHWRERSDEEYSDAFVDLYLLAQSRCVTFGMGGYGRFASWLSFNASCAMQHHAAIGVTPCSLAKLPAPSTTTTYFKEAQLDVSIFNPPMPMHDHG